MSFAISDPAVVINNESVNLVPSTVTYTEGFGEQSVRAQSSGNGRVDQVYSDDVTTHYSMIKFEVYNTVDSIELARRLKANKNGNTITVSGIDPTSGKKVLRTFKKAALTNNFEVQFGNDSSFELEFMTLPAA
jgi:hypothetical protein